VWTYIERMAVLAGFESQQTGIGLAIGVSFGIPGALLASWCGDRFGRVAPLTVGALGTVLALALLNQAMPFAAYVLAAALYNFVWNFSLAYQYAAVNAVDPGGRGVAAAPAFHGAGAAVGPALVALYVTQTSLVAVNIAAGIAVMLSLLLLVWAIGLASGRAALVKES
jgi:MFS family permease